MENAAPAADIKGFSTEFGFDNGMTLRVGFDATAESVATNSAVFIRDPTAPGLPTGGASTADSASFAPPTATCIMSAEFLPPDAATPADIAVPVPA